MFHHDDHLRFSTFSTPRCSPRGDVGRARARNTDLDVLLDKVGLSGRARKL
jgi:hypothetical protein